MIDVRPKVSIFASSLILVQQFQLNFVSAQQVEFNNMLCDNIQHKEKRCFVITCDVKKEDVV